MICPNCNTEMNNETVTDELVTVQHTCATCGKRHNVSFADGRGYNPFASLRDINLSANPRIQMAGRTFAMQLGDWYFATKMADCRFLRWNEAKQEHESYTERKPVNLENLAVEKTVTYTDLETSKVYEWQCIAFGEYDAQGRKLRIRRFLYLNGELFKATDFAWYTTNAALANNCSEPKDAVLMALAHAESLTKAMAMGEYAHE